MLPRSCVSNTWVISSGIDRVTVRHKAAGAVYQSRCCKKTPPAEMGADGAMHRRRKIGSGADALKPLFPFFALFVGDLGEQHFGHGETVTNRQRLQGSRQIIGPIAVVGLHRGQHRI